MAAGGAPSSVASDAWPGQALRMCHQPSPEPCRARGKLTLPAGFYLVRNCVCNIMSLREDVGYPKNMWGAAFSKHQAPC